MNETGRERTKSETLIGDCHKHLAEQNDIITTLTNRLESICSTIPETAKPQPKEAYAAKLLEDISEISEQIHINNERLKDLLTIIEL